MAVALHNRRFYSEKMGDIVTERLSESFSDLMDYGFTAGMEENLDDVAQGERDWKNVLDEFWPDVRRNGITVFQYIGEICRYLLNQPALHARRRVDPRDLAELAASFRADSGV